MVTTATMDPGDENMGREAAEPSERTAHPSPRQTHMDLFAAGATDESYINYLHRRVASAESAVMAARPLNGPYPATEEQKVKHAYASATHSSFVGLHSNDPNQWRFERETKDKE